MEKFRTDYDEFIEGGFTEEQAREICNSKYIKIKNGEIVWWGNEKPRKHRAQIRREHIKKLKNKGVST